MEDLKPDSFGKRKEIIDGITIIHSGVTQYVVGPGNKKFPREILEMYDSNGNRFYSNFESVEEANEEIAKLAEKGITAVIGPKAPWRDPESGDTIPNRLEDAVGVYVVSVPEKNEDFSSHKIR